MCSRGIRAARTAEPSPSSRARGCRPPDMAILPPDPGTGVQIQGQIRPLFRSDRSEAIFPNRKKIRRPQGTSDPPYYYR
ncbi:hypothetical protein J2129_000001 [Methanofollis sp. W23]|nr:hypothetical protein [Methanofollis sp. W23]